MEILLIEIIPSKMRFAIDVITRNLTKKSYSVKNLLALSPLKKSLEDIRGHLANQNLPILLSGHFLFNTDYSSVKIIFFWLFLLKQDCISEKFRSPYS